MTMITFRSDGPSSGQQREREDHRRERLQRVHDDDQRVVDPAADVARDDAQDEADDERRRAPPGTRRRARPGCRRSAARGGRGRARRCPAGGRATAPAAGRRCPAPTASYGASSGAKTHDHEQRDHDDEPEQARRPARHLAQHLRPGSDAPAAREACGPEVGARPPSTPPAPDADARVEEAVGEVGEQVGEHEQHGDDEHAPRTIGKLRVCDRVDDQRAEARAA